MAEPTQSGKRLVTRDHVLGVLWVRASVAILAAVAPAATAAAGLVSTTRRIATPPSYLGSRDNGPRCATRYDTIGYEPVNRGRKRHPLFLYFIGSSVNPSQSQFESEAPRRVTEAMARRGFVALSVEYDNGYIALFSDHAHQLTCLFGAENPENLLTVACALHNVNCDLGIATWGHSQGALMAHMAANADDRVRAVWTTGYGGERALTAMLPKNRLRVVNGERDGGNGRVPVLNAAAGFTAAECPDDGRRQCLRSDGSGWIRVAGSDCKANRATHCWFFRKTCRAPSQSIEPNSIDPAWTKPFALEANADWVARTALRRPHPTNFMPFHGPRRQSVPRHPLLPAPRPQTNLSR